jgi:hypothetical protein
MVCIWACSCRVFSSSWVADLRSKVTFLTVPLQVGAHGAEERVHGPARRSGVFVLILAPVRCR